MRTFAYRLFLHVCRALGLFLLADLLYQRRLLIIGYRGIELDDEAACMPERFIRAYDLERRLDIVMRRRRKVLSLSEALRRMRSGRLPRHPVVLSFDGGFYSTCAKALPLLRRHRLPAVCYVDSRGVDSGLPDFDLCLRYLLWKTRFRQVRLRGLRWAADQDLDLTRPGERERFRREVVEYAARHCDDDAKDALAMELAALFGVNYIEVKRRRLFSQMNRVELGWLWSGRVELQLHGHGPREIEDSRKLLEGISGRSCAHLSYPEGSYRRELRPLLRRLGISSAVTGDPGFNDADIPTLELRRFMDSALVSEIEFEAELCGFADLLRHLRARVWPQIWARIKPVPRPPVVK